MMTVIPARALRRYLPSSDFAPARYVILSISSWSVIFLTSMRLSRTHDELLKLGFQLAQSSVAKYMVQPPVAAAANSFRVARPR